MPAYLALAISLLSAGPAFSQTRRADETALQALVSAFEAAVNERDAAAVAGLFTADGDSIIGDGPLLTGRAAIQAAEQRDFDTAPTRRISLAVTGIRFFGSNFALVETRAQFNEGPVMEDRGTSVAARQPGGDWLIAALRVLPAARGSAHDAERQYGARMTLEQYAYVADIVGVALVIASLVYLAKQVRQNNVQLKLQSYQAWVASNLEINMNCTEPSQSELIAKGNFDAKNLTEKSFVAFAMFNLAIR